MPKKILLFILFLFFLENIKCVYFELEYQRSKCFTEEIPSDFHALVDVEAQTPWSYSLEFLITDPHFNIIHESKIESKHNHKFIVKKGGEYNFCFYSSLMDQPIATDFPKRRIFFKLLTGTNPINLNEPNNEHLKPVYRHLRRMEENIKDIIMEYNYYLERESRMRETTDTSHSRAQWLGGLSLVVTIAVSIWRVFYLKAYFIKKKLI